MWLYTLFCMHVFVHTYAKTDRFCKPLFWFGAGEELHLVRPVLLNVS